jgi:hypothetical protein
MRFTVWKFRPVTEARELRLHPDSWAAMQAAASSCSAASREVTASLARSMAGSLEKGCL